MLREAALAAFATGNHAVARVSNKTRRVSELACRPRVLHRRKKGAEAAQQVASIPAKPPGSAAQTGHDETQESSCWLTIRRGALARSRGTAAIYAQLALRLGTRWHRLGGKEGQFAFPRERRALKKAKAIGRSWARLRELNRRCRTRPANAGLVARDQPALPSLAPPNVVVPRICWRDGDQAWATPLNIRHPAVLGARSKQIWSDPQGRCQLRLRFVLARVKTTAEWRRSRQPG